MTYLTAPGAMFVSFVFKTLNTEEIKIIDLSKLNKSSFVLFGCFIKTFKKMWQNFLNQIISFFKLIPVFNTKVGNCLFCE